MLVSNLLRGRDDRLSTELSTMDIAPLSPAQFGSPFAPSTSSLSRIRRGVTQTGAKQKVRRGAARQRDGPAMNMRTTASRFRHDPKPSDTAETESVLRTIIALFDDTIDAEHALTALRKSDHPSEGISVILRERVLDPDPERAATKPCSPG